ncbi:MAG: hypothetical protein ACK4FY_00185 [Aquificaceae bacterium]
MISGYLSSRQALVDLLNGCLFSKVGVLNIFLGVNTVSLYVDKGLIKGFKLGAGEDVQNVNKRSMLLYHLSELMENPEAFFTFIEGITEKMVELEEPMPAEELVLQLQLVHKELKTLMDRVVTPLAVVKVLKGFERSDFYDGKSVYYILMSSPGSLVEEIRNISSLFSKGYLDINQFQSPEALREDLEIDYLMKNIETERINLITLLENFQLSKFTGIMRITGGDFEFELCYKRGQPLAVYPYTPEIFDFLLNPKSRSLLSVIRLGSSMIDLLMLKHAENRVVCGLPASFMEIGKMLMAMSVEGRTGIITVYSGSSKSHILYKKGMLLSIVQEDGEAIKVISKISFEKANWVDVIFYQPMENIKDVVHLFLLDVIYGILLRHASHLNHMVLSQLSSSEVLKYQEGAILYRRRPRGNEGEAFGFLQFLLDLSYNMLGQDRFEQELEVALQPYRDILKVLRVEDYIKLPEA